MKKGIQFFTKEYLERCRGMTPDQIIEFLENYRMLFAKPASSSSNPAPLREGRNPDERSQLISLKIKPSLLQAFKRKAASKDIPYQTQIKKLMMGWLEMESK